jgi:hypothetical protein
LSAGATGTAFTALHLKHQFRVIVSFHNSAGISAGSPPVVAIAR